MLMHIHMNLTKLFNNNSEGIATYICIPVTWKCNHQYLFPAHHLPHVMYSSYHHPAGLMHVCVRACVRACVCACVFTQ